MYLASLWGPVLFAVGIGIFASRNYYTKLYRDLEKAPIAVLTIGLALMAAGLAQIQAHTVWDSLPQIVVTLLGWGALLKGVVFIIAPGFADRTGESWAKLNLIPIAGVGTLVLGGYLSYLAYLA